MGKILKFRKEGWKKGLLSWALLGLFCCGCFLMGAGAYYLYDLNVQENKIDSIRIPVKERPIKVSVIIPVYNTAPYLERCLDSAINQTLKDIEIICVNDGSTDNSLEILQKYAQKDKRIKVVNFKENKGVSAARNKGINLAKGEFIGFLDSDDFIDPGWYENLYNQSEGYDFVRGVRLIDGWYRPRKPYQCLIPSILRTKFIKDNGVLFEKVPHEDAVFAKKLRKFRPKKKDAKDNGQRHHYERREGSLQGYKLENMDKEIEKWKRKLNVVFNVNNDFIIQTEVAIHSIVRNSKSKYIFWILESNISDKNKEDIKKYVKDIGQEVVFITIDPKYLVSWAKIHSGMISPDAMARILTPDLLPETVEKALYLDVDILVAEDLKNLFNEDLKDKYIGMVQDKYTKVEKDKKQGYYNAGIILFNLKKMREDKIVSRMLQFLKKEPWNFQDTDAQKFWMKNCQKFSLDTLESCMVSLRNNINMD